jgi:hypothetical protein
MLAGVFKHGNLEQAHQRAGLLQDRRVGKAQQIGRAGLIGHLAVGCLDEDGAGLPVGVVGGLAQAATRAAAQQPLQLVGGRATRRADTEGVDHAGVDALLGVEQRLDLAGGDRALPPRRAPSPRPRPPARQA